MPMLARSGINPAPRLDCGVHAGRSLPFSLPNSLEPRTPMSTLPPRLEGMDPELQRRLAIAAMDLGLNILADRHEEQFYFPHPQFTDHDRRVGHAIHSSMDNRSLKRFSDVLFDEGCVLSGFECATQDLQYEVGMMAWTDEDNLAGFKYLAACPPGCSRSTTTRAIRSRTSSRTSSGTRWAPRVPTVRRPGPG